MEEGQFFSIDRLVEFGLGMSIAQQMIRSMNTSMNNMQVAGGVSVLPQANNKIYYAMLEGKQAGPFSESELTRLISEKRVVKETYLWTPGLNAWKLAEQIPEVLRLVALTPPPFTQKDEQV